MSKSNYNQIGKLYQVCVRGLSVLVHGLSILVPASQGVTSLVKSLCQACYHLLFREKFCIFMVIFMGADVLPRVAVHNVALTFDFMLKLMFSLH